MASMESKGNKHLVCFFTFTVYELGGVFDFIMRKKKSKYRKVKVPGGDLAPLEECFPRMLKALG